MKEIEGPQIRNYIAMCKSIRHVWKNLILLKTTWILFKQAWLVHNCEDLPRNRNRNFD